jgi:hypothetical protein
MSCLTAAMRARSPTAVMRPLTGFDLWLINCYIPQHMDYWLWRATWDTTEEQDFINGTSRGKTPWKYIHR